MRPPRLPDPASQGLRQISNQLLCIGLPVQDKVSIANLSDQHCWDALIKDDFEDTLQIRLLNNVTWKNGCANVQMANTIFAATPAASTGALGACSSAVLVEIQLTEKQSCRHTEQTWAKCGSAQAAAGEGQTSVVPGCILLTHFEVQQWGGNPISQTSHEPKQWGIVWHPEVHSLHAIPDQFWRCSRPQQEDHLEGGTGFE